MATRPISREMAVQGISRASPPIFSMSFSPVCCSMVPAANSNALLNRLWFNKWNRPPIRANAVTNGCCSAIPTMAPPMPSRMMPIFSSVW
ncbi:hypothetical protein D3C76_1346010 [compost metagenome]